MRKSELELDGKEEKEEGRPYFGGGGVTLGAQSISKGTEVG